MTKKILLRSTLFLSLLPLLSGCVTGQKFRNLQFNVRNQDNRLVDIENQMEQISSGGTSATQSVQKQQASISSELERLSMEILQIKGQLDEARHRSRTLQEENLRLQQELDNRLLNLEAMGQTNAAKLVVLGDNITEIKTKMAEEAEQRALDALQAAKDAKRRAAVAAAAQAATATASDQTKEITPRIHKKKKTGSSVSTKTPVQTEQPAPVPASAKTPAEKLYDLGLGQYRSEDYKGAITSFTTFLDRHHNSKLVPNARFWLGSGLLKSGDYSGAVLEFQNIVADYPGHPKAPEALLKQAKAFEHFGDKMVQKKLYKDILTYYPKSEQAAKAKKLLGKLQ
ncbi:MAG: tol-pal system protein YbgF [Thermodesulfobacteriota bacterium]